MFGYLSIFSGIEISIFRDVFPDAVCRFAKIIAKIGISGFRYLVILGSEITGITLRPVEPGIFGKGNCKMKPKNVETLIREGEVTCWKTS